MNFFYTRPDRTWYPGVFPKPAVVHLQINGAPACLQGKCALFFSDVHLRRQVSDARLRDFIALIASQRADLILMGGDYAEGDDQCQRFFEAFRGVTAPLGCFAVAGNNDFPSAASLGCIMADAGVTLLKNDTRSIALPGGTLQIGGCEDHKYGSPDTAHLFSDAADYRILLSHFPVMPDCACSLMLSGHTHAGQCNVLGVTPYSIGFEHRFHLLGVRGLHRFGQMQLLIGSGIGVSRFPFRLNAQPQIYRIDFT